MDRANERRIWLAAHTLSGLLPWLAAAGAALVAWRGPWRGSLLRLDGPGSVMLLLVTFLGWVVVRYSRSQLRGEPRQGRYLLAVSGTLLGATLVVLANHLVVVGLAWLCTSLALHRLLTFRPDRPAALLSAHKKFLASRFADLCLAGAIACLQAGAGTLRIDEIEALLARSPEVAASPWLQVAAVLLVVAAALRSAQLPVHGWLIQVMEAPTPVSALLHAGVVNLGGFVCLRMAPLVLSVPAAQLLLVVVGGTTALLCSLVVPTRVSVKIALAWSTCAQMGLLLVECGLGATDLALLHLVGHSLYKAHAFLGSGDVVLEVKRRHLAPAARHAGPADAAAGLLLASVVVTTVGLALAPWSVLSHHPGSLLAGWLLALALAPVVFGPSLPLGYRVALLPACAALAAVGFGLHALAAGLAPPGSSALTAPLATAFALSVSVVYLVQAVLTARPDGGLARRLYPWCFAGFYLDEIFTRATFRLWPQPEPALVKGDRP